MALPRVVIESPIVREGRRLGFELYMGLNSMGFGAIHRGGKRVFISGVSGKAVDPQTGRELKPDEVERIFES